MRMGEVSIELHIPKTRTAAAVLESMKSFYRPTLRFSSPPILQPCNCSCYSDGHHQDEAARPVEGESGKKDDTRR
jgi:hypothetical protein